MISAAVLFTVTLVLSLVPAVLFWHNATRFYRPPPDPPGPLPAVSVLIPARNEEAVIAAAVESALASRGVELEVIVLDDHSTDRTAAIVREIAGKDGRARVESAPALPPGWCGKQHACFALSKLANHPLLCFLDADVRLAPDGLARLAAFWQLSGADLVSGIPRQETGTFLEKLVLPLIHFLLLGFLPMGMMRASRHPGFGAGCGQLFLTHRPAYDAVGGHEAVKGSLHDGITLPRAYRRAGRMTDLCDATDLAVCRMYRSAAQVWFGLAKNAREGLAAAVVPWTLILVGGQVLPFALVPWLGWPALLPVALAYGPRFHAAWRFRQSWLGAALHPLGILTLLAIQWYAVVCGWLGRPVGWKGRPHPVGS